jgi:hypothetical protein
MKLARAKEKDWTTISIGDPRGGRMSLPLTHPLEPTRERLIVQGGGYAHGVGVTRENVERPSFGSALGQLITD